MFLYDELHEKLHTGHEVIDQQHVSIARAAVKLYEDLRSKVDQSVILASLNEALRLTEINFKYEEELMDKFNFVMKMQHQNQHDKYLNQLKEKIKLIEQEKLKDVEDFSTIIKNWVFNHIIGMDRKLVVFIKAKED